MNNDTYPRFDADSFIGSKSDIKVMHRKANKCPLHWHDYFEFEIITAGHGIHILNGKEYEISEGSAYLIFPTDFHEVSVKSPISLYNISFRENMLDEKVLLKLLSQTTNKVQQLSEDIYDKMVSVAKLLKSECESNDLYSKILLEYLLHFYSDMSISHSSKSEQLSGIKKAMIYMELHFREKLTLTQIAEQAGFNPSYFSVLFKKITGGTYLTRLNNLRLEYACTLLLSGCTVSYACFESGFTSMSNFYTSFKKKYKISPSEYAAKNRRQAK